jgi:hypothetical protein
MRSLLSNLCSGGLDHGPERCPRAEAIRDLKAARVHYSQPPFDYPYRILTAVDDCIVALDGIRAELDTPPAEPLDGC